MKGYHIVKCIYEDNTCDYCGTGIKWAFHISHPEAADRVVGRECVKSFCDNSDPKLAMDLFQKEWRQRRTYYWKRVGKWAVIMGSFEPNDWWGAIALSIQERQKWHMLDKHYPTYELLEAALWQEVSKR